MIDNIKCNLCHSEEYDVLYKGGLRANYKKEMYYPTSSNLAIENIVRCRKCNLVYMNPQLDSDTLLGYYSEGEDKEYTSHMNERVETFCRIIDIIGRFIQKGRLLDIGCGAGFLLCAARKRGWSVKGIEPNRYFVDFGRNRLGLDILNKTVSDAEFPQNYFDVIMLWDTLEHLIDPYECLVKSYRWLRPDGYLFINTPNIDSIFAKLLKNKWWFINSMHLYYFSPHTINRYLKKSRFKFVEIKPHCQTLKLVYLISKLKIYSESISRVLASLSVILNLKDIKIKYYAGQMTVVAQKK